MSPFPICLEPGVHKPSKSPSFSIVTVISRRRSQKKSCQLKVNCSATDSKIIRKALSIHRCSTVLTILVEALVWIQLLCITAYTSIAIPVGEGEYVLLV